MKPRYNLRIQSVKVLLSTTNKTRPSISSSPSSRVTKKAKPHRSNGINNENNRRHSLRLTPDVKETIIQEITNPKLNKAENDNEDSLLGDDDREEDLLARHQRHMLEEQKDRKLYERYIRGQRALRRLQCRRSHTAHLNETTRNRLLRELERERRYLIHDKICTHLANHTIIFRHGCYAESKQPIDWSTLEEEIPHNRNIGDIHELDVMINNLKKVIRNSKSSRSKPRLGVRERQNQRLATTTPIKSDVSQTTTINTPSPPSPSNLLMNIPSQLSIIAYSPRVPLVRFIDDQHDNIQTSNSQHLTCIQNVLLHHNNNKIATNELSTPMTIRKSFLRPKSSPMKKQTLEKENCGILPSIASSNTHSNIVLRNSSPMVSIKYSTSTSSSRTYRNTRKRYNSLTTRRQTRLSTNV